MFISKEQKAAMTRGKMQYPRTQTDWKKLIFPFSSKAFTVTTPKRLSHYLNSLQCICISP